ncbi:MAG: lantibiotic immunity ABC transporter MutG family permease subunit [Peptococcaceae bacterium]|nr:lantibiotic immunity ABC transporter MutG family permease subunit [Peptococcaceae bacterium]
MMAFLRAEWLKTKRTALRWLVFALPVLTGAVLGWYCSGRAWISAADAYSGFFSVWTNLLSLLIGIVGGQLVEEEAQAGAFSGFLALPRPRRALYLGKLAALLLSMALANVLAVASVVAVLQMTGTLMLSPSLYALTMAMILIASVPICALSLWLSLGAGMGASVGVGICGVLLAAIVGGTNLGNALWPVVPWAWPVRFCAFAALLYEGGLAPVLYNQLKLGCAVVAISGILFIIGGVRWFSRWDGRATGD